MSQLIHCHSLSLAPVKSRLVLPFWYRLTQVVLEKRPLNGCSTYKMAAKINWHRYGMIITSLSPNVYIHRHTWGDRA